MIRDFGVLIGIMVLTMTADGVAQEWHKVVTNNFGNDGKQPSLAQPYPGYSYPEKAVSRKVCGKKSPARTVVHDPSAIKLAFIGLKPKASYKVKLTFLSDSPARVQRVAINGKEAKAPFKVPHTKIESFELAIPAAAAKRGKALITIENVKGPNAVISQAELWSTDPELEPRPFVQLGPGSGKQLEGSVRDAFTNRVLLGFTITGRYGSGKSLPLTPNAKGIFSLDLPAAWLKDPSKAVTVTATNGEHKITGEITIAEIVANLPPRISPIPSAVAGLEDFRKSLDGTWKFCTKAPDKLTSLTTAPAAWKNIAVPGEWAMQSFHVEKNQAAAYVRTFTIPAEWKGKRIKLRFNSVYSECSIYVNGKQAGSHLGGFTAFEVDVTHLVKAGDNILALSVKNESVADSLASGSKYACHPLGGIPRSVSLFALPNVQLSSLVVRTPFDKEFKNATLAVLAELTNEGANDASGVSVSVELTRWKSNKQVPLNPAQSSAITIKAGGSRRITINAPVDSPATWDCENPNLYMLTCKLMKGGVIVETVQQRFGFRQYEVVGNQVMVNGKPVRLRGVNRHEVYPLTGRSVPKACYRQDIELFRGANVNIIRTSHYPPDEMLMEMADELGMFIECEAPFCWAHSAKGDKKALHNATVRQTQEMVLLNRNHPSILYWSMGNESRWNSYFEASSKAAAKLDPTRPMTFDTWGWRVSDPICAIGGSHYPGHRQDYTSPQYPRSFGEYCHLNAYNRYELATDKAVRDKWGIYLSKMWERMIKSDGCLGGNVWAGIDDTFYWDYDDGTTKEERTVGYGTWGPIDGWRRKKPEWWGMKKAYSPAHVNRANVKMTANGLTIPIENRLDFSNMSRLKITWKLGKQSGTVNASVPPRSKGELQIPVKAAGGELELTFTDPRGFVVDTYLIPVGTPARKSRPKTSESYTVQKAGDKIVVMGKAVRYTIDSTTGLFQTAEYTGTTMKLSGPHLMILPLNGSGGTQMHGPTKYYEPYTHTCSNWRSRAVEQTTENSLPVITVKGAYKEAEGSFTYRFARDGTFTVDYNFKSLAKVNPRQLGIVFEMDKAFENLTWKRKGYWSTYPDWHIARLSGTANATEGVKSGPVGPRKKPSHEWRYDRTKLGCHDFTSTKHQIFSASLTNSAGLGLHVIANADRHTRTWIEGGSIRMLIATYSNGGSERFLRRLSKIDDAPLTKGSAVVGSAILRIGKK